MCFLLLVTHSHGLFHGFPSNPQQAAPRHKAFLVMCCSHSPHMVGSNTVAATVGCKGHALHYKTCLKLHHWAIHLSFFPFLLFSPSFYNLATQQMQVWRVCKHALGVKAECKDLVVQFITWCILSGIIQESGYPATFKVILEVPVKGRATWLPETAPKLED